MKNADQGRKGLIVKLKVSMRPENCPSDEGSVEDRMNYNEKTYKTASNFVNKVRMRDEVVYRKFLQVFRHKADMTTDELILLVSLRLEEYDDLLEEFLSFLPPLQLDPELATLTATEVANWKCPDGGWNSDNDDKRKIHKSALLNLFAKAKEKLFPMDYQQLLGHIYNYAIKKIGGAELKKEIEDILISSPDLLRELKLYLKNLEDFYATSSMKVMSDGPIPEVQDSLISEAATSGRTEHEKQVLNDD